MGTKSGTPDAGAPADPYVQPPLVGREREQELLRQQLVRTVDGHGRLVLISGEAGVGKTALVDWFAASARELGVTVLAGSCYDLTITPPYGPWIEGLSTFQHLDGLSTVIGTLRDVASLTGTTHREVLDRIRFALAELAAQAPVLLLLEDLHWADAASLDLLRRVSRQLDSLRLLLVVTWRDDEAISEQSSVVPTLIREAKPLRIALPRLNDQDTRELVTRRYRLTDDDAELLGEWVQRRGEGNPFFAGEVLLALEQQEALRFDGDVWRFTPPNDPGVPRVVQQVIEQRLSRLSRATQHVLEFAAIIGQDVSVEFLQRAADVTDDKFDASLDEAVANHIVTAVTTSDVSLRFRHALVRETLYVRQSAVRRRARHRRVAELLLVRPDPAPVRLAYHFQAAHDPRCVEWLVRAGEQSLKVYAPHDAITNLTYADQSAQSFGTLLPTEAIRSRGRAWEMVGNFDFARSDYEMTLSRARADGDRRIEWHALLDLGTLWAERDYERAGEALQDALALARQDLSDDEVAHSLNAVGNWHVNHEEPQPAISYHQQALAIFSQSNNRHGIAATLDVLALAQYIAGDVRGAAIQYERAVGLLEALDDRQLLSSALANWATTGGYFESDATAVVEGTLQHWLTINARALSIARQIGWAAGEAYAQIQAGAILGTRGEMGQATDRATAGMRMAEEIGHKQWMVCGHIALGRIHADLGEISPARRHLTSALGQARAIASPLWIDFSTAALVLFLVDVGERETAAELIDRTRIESRPAVSTMQRLCHMAWAQLLTACNEPERALRVVDDLIDTAPNASGSRSLPWLALTRGKALAALGRTVEAEADLRSARLGALDLGYRHLLVRADLALGQLVRDSGRRS